MATKIRAVPVPIPSDRLPSRLPQGWRLIDDAPDCKSWRGFKGMAVIVSCLIEADGKTWLHASISGRKLPTYEDLSMLKRVWIGDDVTAYQVFPPRSQHVNIHENCLHLWCCLDGDVTPDFSRGLGMI